MVASVFKKVAANENVPLAKKLCHEADFFVFVGIDLLSALVGTIVRNIGYIL